MPKPSPEPSERGSGVAAPLMASDALTAWLAEYNSLRAEIEWLIKDATRYQSFAITLLGILVPGVGWLLKELPDLVVPSLLVISFIYCLLGFLYTRQHEEVYVVAAYLKDYVRPRVRELMNDSSMWGWEEFKGQRWAALRPRRGLGCLRPGNMIVLLRAMLFVLPSAAALAAVGFILLQTYRSVAFSSFHAAPVALLAAAFLFNTAVLGALLRHLFLRNRLPRDLLGLDA